MDNSSERGCAFLSHGTSWLSRVPGEPLVAGDDDNATLATHTTHASLAHQYFSALYWSLTVLIKTPWVGPDTVLEKVVASVAVMVGAITFAALLGMVTALTQSFDKAGAQRREKTALLHQARRPSCTPPANTIPTIPFVCEESPHLLPPRCARDSFARRVMCRCRCSASSSPTQTPSGP